jgi:hypothetical protein
VRQRPVVGRHELLNLPQPVPVFLRVAIFLQLF